MGRGRPASAVPASTPHLQSGGAIDPMHTFVIHDEPVSLKQDVQPSIAEAGADRRVRLESRQHRHVGGVRPSLIAPRRRAEPDHATRPPQTRAARPEPPHRRAPTDTAYPFFATTALSS